jgi:ubiquinone/menaquinone biosynthesis C-methylase UbiE
MEGLSYPAKTAYQNRNSAETYDRLRFESLKGRIADKREKKIIGELLKDLPKGSVVLDLACGTGRIAGFLLSKGHKVWGVDISPQMLEVARKRLSAFGELVKLRQGEAEHLPFEERFFDSATCIKLMGHVPPKTRIKILREIKRITKGPFVVAYYISGPVVNIKRKIKKLLTGNKAPWFPAPENCLKKEVASANLKILREKSVLKHLSETLILLLD